jgi:CheY-like chemotaxis protein
MNTVLVVDDEPNIRLMTCLQLKQAGYTVTAAEDGEHALTILEGSRPDAVLLDLEMPGVDGLRVLEELHSRRLIADLPVIVFSVHADVSEVLERIQQLGCRAILRKPYAQQELLEAVRAALAA